MLWVFSEAEGKDFSLLTFGVGNMRNETRVQKEFLTEGLEVFNQEPEKQISFCSSNYVVNDH